MTFVTPPEKLFSHPPPEAWVSLLRLSQRLARPLERFLEIEAASGILLLISAALAMVWANSPWAESYFHLWHTRVGIRIGAFAFERSLEWIVNDGLMVIFFFVVGMEIRREIHQGELSEWQKASLPAAAALGGMLVPAAIYLAIAGAPATQSGWGIPMATDIAFAIGILTLLGRRVPTALRVLLLAVAVIDDLGAIIVIALFYSSGIVWTGFAIAALGISGIFLLQRFGVRSKLTYIVPTIVSWAGIYNAGVHPTIAGVLVGLLTPVRAWLGPNGFLETTRGSLEHLAQSSPSFSSHELARTLRQINIASQETLSPAESLIGTLHPWVAFGIMPIFALANAGVPLSIGSAFAPDSQRVMASVAIGLIVGKPVGILSACWLALRLRIGTLPIGLTLWHLVVLGVVAGIGFTMSLFIAPLGFSNSALLAAAKLGILVGSGIAAILGLLLGTVFLSPISVVGTGDETRQSTKRIRGRT